VMLSRVAEAAVSVGVGTGGLRVGIEGRYHSGGLGSE